MSAWFDATLCGAVFVTLFVILDPLGSIPLFLGLTGVRTNRTRARLAGQAVLVSLLVISLFAVVGQQILDFLGSASRRCRARAGCCCSSSRSSCSPTGRTTRRSCPT